MSNPLNVPKAKEIKPINFLFQRAEITVADLIHQLPIAKQLFRESVQLDLHPCGPIHWHYSGFTGDESTPFTLEVCLPIAQAPVTYDGQFHFKRTDHFKCVTLQHEGAWHNLPRSYAIIMEFMQRHQLEPGGVTRELYINADFTDPDANITEIQMGIL